MMKSLMIDRVKSVFGLVLLFIGLGWSDCTTYTVDIQLGNTINCSYGRCSSLLCSETTVCDSCLDYVDASGNLYTDGWNLNRNEPLCTNNSSCWNWSGKQKCRYTTRCNGVSADSVTCVHGGGQWVDSQCKMSSCTSADTTWLNNSKAACNAIDGTNNYAIVDTNDVCEHRGICCSSDSLINGNICKWRCEDEYGQCQPPLTFYSGILPDTISTDTGTTIQKKCRYNCIHYIPPDTTMAMVSGNILLVGSTTPISDGTKTPNTFSSVRSNNNGTYTYDFLSPQAEQYLDSIAFTPCVQVLYRGTLNGKYVYWYDNQTAPTGVTNIVKIR